MMREYDYHGLPSQGAMHPDYGHYEVADVHQSGQGRHLVTQPHVAIDVLPHFQQLSSSEPTESEYLALFGASELFAQLD